MSNPGKPVPSTTTTPAPIPFTLNLTEATAPSWRRDASFWNDIYLSIRITGVLDAILILIANLFLLGVILSSAKLRGTLRNHLVLSLVIANLIVGVFSSPFFADFAKRRNWVHGCYFHVVQTLLTVHVQNFVSLWGVVLLVLHYLGRLLQYEGPAFLVRLPATLRRLAPAVYVALPWIIAAVLIIPLVFGGLHRYVWYLWTDMMCPIVLSRWAVYTLNVLTFFLPALIVIGLIVAVIFVYRRRVTMFGTDAMKKMEMGSNLVGEGEVLEGPAVYIVVTVLTVVFLCPEHVSSIDERLAFSYWKHIVITQVIVLLLSELHPFVLALALLFMLADVRMRVVELLSMIPGLPIKRAPPKSSDTTVAPVAFRDLHDD